MAEYIEREALMRNLKQFAPEQLTPLIESLIQKQPVADVVKVVRKPVVGYEGCYDVDQLGSECKIRSRRRCIYKRYGRIFPRRRTKYSSVWNVQSFFWKRY